MKNSVLLFFVLLNVVVVAQNDTLFIDTFENNNQKWVIDSTENFTLRLNNNLYEFENLSDNQTFSSTQGIEIDAYSDWSIGATIQYKNGDLKNNAGIIWGGNNTNEYNFLINDRGEFCVLKFENDTLHFIIDWSFSKALKKNADSIVTNQLTVKKINNTLKFYINDIYVGRNVFEKTFGNKIGFSVGERSKVSYDELLVCAKKSTYSIPPSLPELSINNLTFGTLFGSTVLHPLEEGELNFVLTNNGGDAYDIEILIVNESYENNFLFENIYYIDKIKGGESRNISLKIQPDIDTQRANNKFKIFVSEINSKEVIKTDFVIETEAGITNSSDDSEISHSEDSFISCLGITVGIVWLILQLAGE